MVYKFKSPTKYGNLLLKLNIKIDDNMKTTQRKITFKQLIIIRIVTKKIHDKKQSNKKKTK